jgi:hypothetical protein
MSSIRRWRVVETEPWWSVLVAIWCSVWNRGVVFNVQNRIIFRLRRQHRRACRRKTLQKGAKGWAIGKLFVSALPPDCTQRQLTYLCLPDIVVLSTPEVWFLSSHVCFCFVSFAPRQDISPRQEGRAKGVHNWMRKRTSCATLRRRKKGLILGRFVRRDPW